MGSPSAGGVCSLGSISLRCEGREQAATSPVPTGLLHADFLISSENMLFSSALDGKDTHSAGRFNGGKEGSLKS